MRGRSVGRCVDGVVTGAAPDGENRGIGIGKGIVEGHAVGARSQRDLFNPADPGQAGCGHRAGVEKGQRVGAAPALHHIGAGQIAHIEPERVVARTALQCVSAATPCHIDGVRGRQARRIDRVIARTANHHDVRSGDIGEIAVGQRQAVAKAGKHEPLHPGHPRQRPQRAAHGKDNLVIGAATGSLDYGVGAVSNVIGVIARPADHGVGAGAATIPQHIGVGIAGEHVGIFRAGQIFDANQLVMAVCPARDTRGEIGVHAKTQAGK